MTWFIFRQNFVTADTMRYLTCRGDLNFPHTIVLDFVALDVEASKKELKKKIKRIEGSGNTFFGLKPLQEDAKVVREELTELLRQVEKGREKICKARINFIVFGGRARNRAELNERTETLSERCEQMMSAVRKIPGADAVREEPARVRAIYPRLLAGELSEKETGQEFGEAASSLWIVQCNVVRDGVKITERRLGPDYFSHRAIRCLACA